LIVGGRQPRRGRQDEVSVQHLLLIAAVLLSVATAVASAGAILSLVFRLLSRLR
jgi:hypothetical protein